MTFKRKKPKSNPTRNWTYHIAPKRLQEENLSDLLKIGLDTSRDGESAGEREYKEGNISLEEYSKNRENELIKYNLNCSCDNLAGGIINDQGAMHNAHVMLVLDLLETMAGWRKSEGVERKMAEHFHAQAKHRGGTVVDLVQWGKAKSDKALFGRLFNEAREELLDFETENKDLFCNMSIGQTPNGKQCWKDLKRIHL